MNRFFSLTSRILTACLTLAFAAFIFGAASQANAACVVTNVGGLTGYLHVEGCGSTEKVIEKRFKGAAPAGVTTNEGCIGYSQNLQSTIEVGNGDYNPGPGPGQCEQIDIGSNGVARYGGGGGGGGKACGETCTSNSDCRNPSGNGSPVACVNGTCQNTMCAPGMTIPGGNCSCGANTRKCGETCSGTVGLCGPGQGTCTYVNPPKHWYTGQPDCAWGSTAYCAGNQNGYVQTTCVTGDAPGGTYLTAPNGATSGITQAQIAASCQVCGNGDVEPGEECDMGTNNGKPGYDCTAVTCKKVACNKVCVTSGDCGAKEHSVDVVSSLTAGQDWVFDYFLDNGVYVETAAAGLTLGGGAITPTTDASAHGSQYLHSTLNGVRAGFKTYSSSVIVRTAKGATRGNMIVYVDGKQTQVITGLNVGSGWTDITIPVAAASQYTCYNSGATKNCRLTTAPTSATCSTTTPPTPTPPTPTPTPSALVCDLTPTFTSTGNVSAWKYGDMITYSLPAIPSARIPTGGSARYEGEAKAYRGSTAVKTVTLTPINATASKFQPMKVDVANSTYYFRFRYCVKNSSGVETCTAWGAWAAP